ncbi:MAG: signal peptidase II [Sedimentisphaerales bacterium]|nr:signal peptidase II [Sedimentisphaerales bacterium]
MDTERQKKTNSGASVGRSWNHYITGLPDAKAHLIFWVIVVLGLALDLWTKRAVFTWLEYEPGQGTEIVDGFLSFRLALNDGAAFGIATGRYLFLVAVAALALIVILSVFLFGRAQQRIVQAALGLFAAGVSGNLWDRLFNGGRVRDFIDVVYWPGRHWHTFNVADVMLCVAVALLILATLFTDSSCQIRVQPQK